MIKIASLILDVYDDTSHEIARSLPSEMHELKVAAVDEVADLHDHQFGLVMKTAGGVVRRRFPLHTEDSVKLSRAYFDRVRGDLPEKVATMADAKILGAENGEAIYEVAYIDLSQVPEKTAGYTDRFYGLTIGSSSRYPLHDEELVKTATARFPETAGSLRPEHRFVYARNIEKRASQLGVEIPSDSPIHNYTNPDFNPDSLALAIDQRKAAARETSTEVLDQLLLVAGCELKQGSVETEDSFRLRQSKAAEVPRANPGEIVAVLESFDKLAGLSNYEYNRGLLDPFAACYKRSNYDGSMVVDGIDLSRVDPIILNQFLDPVALEEFNKNPMQVYRSLPDPVKSIIRSASQNGTGQRGASGDGGVESAHAKGNPTDLLNPRFSDPITRDGY